MDSKHRSLDCSPISDRELKILMERLSDLSQTVLDLQEVILNLSAKALASEDKNVVINAAAHDNDVLTAEEIAQLTPRRVLH